LIFGFLIFGPDKMPQIARTVGRVVRQFRNAQDQVNKVIKAEVYDPIKDMEPLMNPFSGFTLDPTKPGDTKKPAETQTSVAATATASSAVLTSKPVSKPKVSSEAVKAAVAADGAAKREQAAKTVVKKPGDVWNGSSATAGTGTASTESFAERRARLEKEHAAAKSAKTPSAADAALEGTPAPATPASVAPAGTDPKGSAPDSGKGGE
jgi:colicin import membrane protein